MSKSKYDRRLFLSSIGLSAAFLPMLDLEIAKAAGGKAPRRLVTVVWPNGVTHGDGYWPKGGETDFQISQVLQPLTPHRDDILILDNIDNNPIKDQFSDKGGHASLPFLLTGGRAQQTGDSCIGSSISVDQHVANALQKVDPTPIHSLVLGVDNREESKAEQKYISFRGPAIGGQPDAPRVTDDVHALYRQLFSGVGMDSTQIDRLRAGRRSLLDYVGGDLARFARNLGSESRQKVQKHLDSIRTMEKQLDQIPVSGPYSPVADDPTLDPYAKDHYDRIARAQVELVVGAMATGQTRVASLLWSNGHNNSWVFKWLGDEFAQPGTGDFNPLRSHHEMAHQGDGGGDATRRKNTIDRYFISLLALFIDRFKSVSEGDGTMLDNSVILFANNMGNGGSHANERLPWVLAGSCGGYFRTGRYVKQNGGKPLNGVLCGLSNAMGVPVQSFGDARYGGELGGLR